MSPCTPTPVRHRSRWPPTTRVGPGEGDALDPADVPAQVARHPRVATCHRVPHAHAVAAVEPSIPRRHRRRRPRHGNRLVGAVKDPLLGSQMFDRPQPSLVVARSEVLRRRHLLDRVAEAIDRRVPITVASIRHTRPSQRSWNSGSSASIGTAPKPCIPPRSCTPSTARSSRRRGAGILPVHERPAPSHTECCYRTRRPP